MISHYTALISSYSFAAISWFLLHKNWNKNPWDGAKVKNLFLSKPYVDFLLAIVAVISIIAIGQLYINGYLIPNKSNNQLLDALNQFLIFSPTFILVLVRKQALESIWLRSDKLLLRISIGLIIAISSLFFYWIIRSDVPSFDQVLVRVYQPQNISKFVQVFMEDITIALIFVRLSNWIGNRWTIVIVASLFAASHIPSMISSGYAITELSSLIFDTFIGVLILSAVSKSRDIWWFFMLHFAMDMTQYL